MKIKTILGFLLLLISASLSFSQPYNQWQWTGGDSSYTLSHYSGAYTGFQVFNATNYPPSYYEACESIDNNGFFYMYGGDPAITSIGRNDVWKYNPTTNQWAWMHGNAGGLNVPNLGTKGVAGFFNSPGNLLLGTTSWNDANGNFWLFGGDGFDPFVFYATNNLWKFDVATNLWTWMHGGGSGSEVGIYGTKGVSAATNLPPARMENDGSWTDNNGNLWMFGGQNYNLDALNDLWMYDVAINQWTWISGTNGINMPAVYGTKGTPSTANYPSGKWLYCTWKDNNNNFWQFGGNNGGDEVWKFNPSTSEWTWVFGQSVVAKTPYYVAKCKDDLLNTPGSLGENRIRWSDDCGNLWIWGGKNAKMGRYGGLWRFSITTNMWKFIGGDSTANSKGIYGLKGVPSATSYPTPRTGGMSWRNGKNLYLFGGEGSQGVSVFNDMWKYYPDKPTAAFSYTTTACTVAFTDKSDPNCGDIKSYLWNFGDGATDVMANPSHTYASAGTYTVTLGVLNCFSIKDSVEQVIVISSCAASVLASTISSTEVKCNGQNTGSVLVSPSGGTPGYTYLWSNGQTSQTISTVLAGNYTVTVTDAASNILVSTATVTEPFVLVVGSTSAPDTCATAMAKINLSPSGGVAGYTYLWSTSATSQNLTNILQGNYSVTITDANNCTITNAFLINNIGSINVTSSGYQTICVGSSAQLNANGGQNYSWLPSLSLNSAVISNPLASPTVTTTYTVNGTTGSCNNSDTLTIKVNPIPLAYAGIDQTTTVGQSVNLSAIGGVSYIWSPSTDLSNANSSSTSFTPTSSGIYVIIVTVTDINGCADKDTIMISVNDIVCGEVYVPTAFSPNKDGTNDVYYVRGNCFKEFNLTIFDRWGEKVYESEVPSNGWDGFFKGELCNTGVYVYTLNAILINGKEVSKKGNLTLLR